MYCYSEYVYMSRRMTFKFAHVHFTWLLFFSFLVLRVLCCLTYLCAFIIIVRCPAFGNDLLMQDIRGQWPEEEICADRKTRVTQITPLYRCGELKSMSQCTAWEDHIRFSELNTSLKGDTGYDSCGDAWGLMGDENLMYDACKYLIQFTNENLHLLFYEQARGGSGKERGEKRKNEEPTLCWD